MWNLMRGIGTALRIVSDVTSKQKDEEEEKKILDILEAPDSDDDCDNIGAEEYNEIVSELSNHRAGYITHFSDDGNGGMIDGQYYFDKKIAPSRIEIGDRVSYIAYRKNENSVWIVKSVFAVCNEDWGEVNEASLLEETLKEKEGNQQNGNVMECSIVGKIVKREGRELFIQPGNYNCHLDKISTTFIPLEGDWVLLKSLVEVDNNAVDKCGKLIQIDSLSSLRSLVNEGQVSHWEPLIKQGIIDSKVLFFLDSCDIGYVPVVGDKVLFNAIESEQGTLVWRALKIVPLLDEYKLRSHHNKSSKGFKKKEDDDDVNIVNIKTPTTKYKSVAEIIEENKINSDVLKNKHGIVITDNCNFDNIDIDSNKEIVIIVHNESKTEVQLLNASFKSSRSLKQPQIQLVSPNIKTNDGYLSKPFFIHGSSSVKFVFKIIPRFVGKTSELFVWKFKDFEIGRRININIVDNFISETLNSKPKKFSNSSLNINSKKLLATRNGFIIPSEKMFRAAAFVPVKMGNFPVPIRFLDAVLGCEDGSSKFDERIRRIKDVAPSLDEPLNKTNYKQRFHALLYLEEIENLIKMRNYDMPRAHFRKHFDYLLLEVPGLAEKRPSLICGDMVIVSNPCTVTDDEDVKYEGSIHKISKTEIWIKFNKSFHNTYNGADYSVIFNVNRNNFRRFHQAVNVAYDHLSSDWLFPSSLGESKTIQVIVEESNDDKISDFGPRENNSDYLSNDDSAKKLLVEDNVFNLISGGDSCVADLKSNSDELNRSNYKISSENSPNCDFFYSKKDCDVTTENVSLNVGKIDLSLNSSNSEIRKSSSSGTDVIRSSSRLSTPRLSVAERLQIALNKNNNSILNQSVTENKGNVSDRISENVEIENKSGFDEKRKLKNVSLSLFDVSSDTSLLSSVKNSTDSIKSFVENSKDDLKSSEDSKCLKNHSINLNNFFNANNDNGNLNSFGKLNVHDSMKMKTLEEIENSLLNSTLNINGNLCNDDHNVTSISHLSENQTEQISIEKFKSLEEIDNSILNKSSGNYNLINNVNNVHCSDVTVREDDTLLTNNKRRNLIEALTPNDISTNNINTQCNDECYSASLIADENVKINWQTTGRTWSKKTGESNCRMRSIPNTRKTKLRWFNPKLNYHQKEAIKNILKGEARPLPYIIFGPPGTGKTITLVEAALQLLHLIPESRLLIATPSNSAANLIAERMLDSGLDLTGVMIRLCSFNYLNNENISEQLKPYCTTADIKVIEEELIGTVLDKRKAVSQSSRDVLGRHRVTIGTCVTLGILYNMGFPQGHFTHILIDEAGQAKEPEILVPLAFLDDKYGQAIFAGDPMQLGPVVHSKEAIDFGFQESLLTRFLQCFPYIRDMQSFPDTGGFDPRVITRLVNNYRTLPEILKLPSSMFYEDSLVPQVKEEDSEEARILMMLKDQLPVRNSESGRKLPPALIFHGIRGVNYQEEDSPSWFNPQEIVQVIFYVNMFYQVGLTADQIGIVTPYQKQVMKIRSCLDKLDIPLPKVGSVEEFQGQERMAIILSPVRSNLKFIVHDAKHALGFVSSPQRLNVALTRARALLVVLGNPHLLNCDPYWRTVLRYCIDNESYIGCDLPPELES